MNVAPLASAGLVVQAHALSALLAIVLGSGELLGSAGILGGLCLLSLLVYRELDWR